MYPYGAAAPPQQRPCSGCSGVGYYANYPVRTQPVGELTTGEAVWSALSLAGTAASAYHGYKRNNSIGWAFVWALMGSIAPVITVPVAFAQGFGKPKKG